MRTKTKKTVRTIVVVTLLIALLCAMVAPAVAFSYNGQRAANFAHYYADKKVSGTDQFQERGDCANFVSHALYYGGWREIHGSYRSSDVWFYNFPYRYGYSHTWAVADRFYDFMSRTSRAHPVSVKYGRHMLQVGDVIQIDYEGDGRKWDHTMIITRKSGGNIYLSHHSRGNPEDTGKRNDLLDDVIHRVKYEQGHSNARFIGWHLHSNY